MSALLQQYAPFIPDTIVGIPSTLVIGGVIALVLLRIFFVAIPAQLRRLRGRIMTMLVASSMVGATGGYTLDSLLTPGNDDCASGYVFVTASQGAGSGCIPASSLQ